jgi:hypothetical protein
MERLLLLVVFLIGSLDDVDFRRLCTSPEFETIVPNVDLKLSF